MSSQPIAADAAASPSPAAPAAPAGSVPFRVAERVRWEDVDLVGVVRYSAFTRLYDVAEQELWRAAGTSVTDLIERLGIWLPRKVLHLEFHAPAKFDDLIDVRIAVSAIGTSSLTLEGEMWSADGATRHASFRVVLVCVDPMFSKYVLPMEIHERLAPFRATGSRDA